MFYYRKNNADGSFEIISTKNQLNQDGWFEIEKPSSAFAIWDETIEEWT